MADCRDCHWASRGPDAAPFDWMCHAPEVIAPLEMDNECTPCRYAREFRNVCGARAAHFRLREGALNGCRIRLWDTRLRSAIPWGEC